MPPLEDEPPHATMKIRPRQSRQPNRRPRSFFLRELKPGPSSASPPIGSSMAKNTPRECGERDAVVAAVVFTVSVEVPVPLVIAAVLNEQVGGRLTAGVTLQVRFTVALKPLTGAIVMVEVAMPPAATVAGVSVDGVMVKSATRAAVTVKLTVVEWFTVPAPATVTVYGPVGVVVEVVTVNAALPEPPATEPGTMAHVGAGVTTGAMLHVRFTVLLKPLSGVTMIEEVAVPPAATELGESADAAMV